MGAAATGTGTAAATGVSFAAFAFVVLGAVFAEVVAGLILVVSEKLVEDMERGMLE